MPSRKKSEEGIQQAQTAEELLAHLPATGDTDTIHALMEVYESVERSYRAAMMAGTAAPRVASSTNPS